MRVLQSILAGLIAFALFYLTGSFIQNSFNITYWSDIARGMVGCYGLFFSVIVFACAFSTMDD